MTQEQMNPESGISNSKLSMFRCMLAIAHADGIYCDEEQGYMRTMMGNQNPPLSEEQREILEDDMANPKALGDILPEIDEPEYRGQVVYFARLMAYKDGELHPNEDDLIERLHANAMDNVDMDALREDVKKAVALNMEAHQEMLEEMSAKNTVFRAFNRIMTSMGLPLSEEN